MSVKERLFHAVLFELTALSIIIPVASIATGTKSLQMMIIGVGMSVFTVIWNYVYNVLFDRLVPGERSERSMMTRVGHALGFEGGLIIFTIPAIAWLLQVSLLTALIIEAGFLVFFFFFTAAFNWAYDKWTLTDAACHGGKEIRNARQTSWRAMRSLMRVTNGVVDDVRRIVGIDVVFIAFNANIKSSFLQQR